MMLRGNASERSQLDSILQADVEDGERALSGQFSSALAVFIIRFTHVLPEAGPREDLPRRCSREVRFLAQS